MERLIVATKNKGKMKEIREIFFALPYEILSMEEAGIHLDVEEDGETFEENAMKKAEAIWAEAIRIDAYRAETDGPVLPDGPVFSDGTVFPDDTVLAGVTVLADDSGLEVDALGGEPGIYSARYGGEGLDDTGRWKLLLQKMVDVPAEDRTARFVCAAAVVSSNRRIVVRGTVEGSILFAPQGSNGFGYDPIFLVEETGKSAAMLDSAEKNRISHRGRAMSKISAELGNIVVNE